MKRVLLDENLPRQLKTYFSAEFDVSSVPDLGWQSKKNGDLLAAMDAEHIDYLLTADRRLRFQQNLEKFNAIVVVLLSYDHRLKNLIPFVKEIESKISDLEPSVKVVEIDLRRR